VIADVTNDDADDKKNPMTSLIMIIIASRPFGYDQSDDDNCGGKVFTSYFTSILVEYKITLNCANTKPNR